MFYRLKSAYMLRGWEGMAWALVQRPKNQVISITQKVFQILVLCDGQTDLHEENLTPSLREALHTCSAEGYIEQFQQEKPLDQEQYYQYYHNRYVQMAFWSVTGRCNFRCRHCYMDAPDALLGELSTEEALNLIDQMAECGILRVDITGGEPLVRKDIWQLIDRILSYKMVIGKFYTNGWMLNESVLDEFESRNLKPQISISFDGVGWHDWMRGVSGAESAALRALKLCYDRGFKTDVEMCIHRGNQDTLPQTIEAMRSVGVTELKTSNVALTDLWRCHSDGNALTQQEYVEAMIRYIPRYYQDGRPIDKLTLSGVIELSKDKPYEVIIRHYDGTEQCLDKHLCSITRRACYITPEGRLLPCLPMTSCPEQNRFPKVQDIGLKKGLSDSFYMQFVNGRIRDLLAANTECANCSYRYKCGGGCRAIALMEGDHNLMGCDRNMCMIWKNGYYGRVEKIAEEAVAKWGDHKVQETI